MRAAIWAVARVLIALSTGVIVGAVATLATYFALTWEHGDKGQGGNSFVWIFWMSGLAVSAGMLALLFRCRRAR